MNLFNSYEDVFIYVGYPVGIVPVGLNQTLSLLLTSV